MVVDSLKQGYSNINLKGPLTKFPFSPRSGKVMVKFQIENSNKKKGNSQNIGTIHKKQHGRPLSASFSPWLKRQIHSSMLRKTL